MGFIESYLEHTKQYESPNSFWLWSAYSAIAGVLRDNCYKKEGISKVWPNIYTLFLAESGHHRKARPVNMCEQLVRRCSVVKIISGRASIQAIVDELSSTTTDKKTGVLIPGGSAIFFAPELSAGIVGDPQAVDILTDIYDCKESYETMLRTRGKQSADHIVFNMLAASNMELVMSTYDKRATGGGLLARTFLVTPDEYRKPNSLWRAYTEAEEEEIKKGINKCLLELVEISKLKGEFVPTKEAIAYYEDWYIPMREGQKNKRDQSGLFGRIHTGATKVAMLRAANRNSLQIEVEDIRLAIEHVTALVPNYNKIVMASGKSEEADIGAIVLNELINTPNGIMSRRDILAKHWTSFSADNLDKFIMTAIQAKLIVELVNGSDINYQITDRCKELMA